VVFLMAFACYGGHLHGGEAGSIPITWTRYVAMRYWLKTTARRTTSWPE